MPAAPPARPGRRLAIAAGLLCSLLAAAVGLRPPLALQALEGRIHDVFLRAAPRAPVSRLPVIVDIDEASLARHGQWPWPRYRVADLLGRVRDLGAAAIGVDIIFAEADRTSLALVVGEVRRDLGLDVPLGADAAERGDNDRTLARTLAGGPFVLGHAFEFGPERATPGCVLFPAAVRLAGEGMTYGAGLFAASGAVCTLPELTRAAGAAGFINIAPDPDGTVRRIPLLVEHGDALHPSLALATLLKARPEPYLTLAGGHGGADRLIGFGREIPLDARGNMLLRFRGPGRSFAYVSAAAVLEGSVPRDALAGRVAFVGTSAAGLKELRATPLDPVFPGPEMHAAALDTILQGDFLRRPRWARGAEALAALLLGVAATLLFAGLRARWSLPALILGSAALWAGAYGLFAGPGLVLFPLTAQGALAGSFALVVSLRFIESERETAAFSRKLSLTQDVIIQSMAALAETRDNETGGHIQRTRHYVKVLAERLRRHPRFQAHLDDRSIELLYKLAPMHDIGKVGVRDRVLLKPAQLTPEEFEEMKRHTIYGDDALEFAERQLGDDSFLRVARQFALTHQEKWDGSGYPQGLKGEDIPVAGRLMAVADVYDALVSRRIYKEPMPHAAAAHQLVAGRGTHFDPDVVDAFVASEEEFRAIAARFRDPGDST